MTARLDVVSHMPLKNRFRDFLGGPVVRAPRPRAARCGLPPQNRFTSNIYWFNGVEGKRITALRKTAPPSKAGNALALCDRGLEERVSGRPSEAASSFSGPLILMEQKETRAKPCLLVSLLHLHLLFLLHPSLTI